MVKALYSVYLYKTVDLYYFYSGLNSFKALFLLEMLFMIVKAFKFLDNALTIYFYLYYTLFI